MIAAAGRHSLVIRDPRSPRMCSTPNDQHSPGAVLIVEDDRINRALLSRHVERMGRRVAVAENGRQALDVLARDSCDLVLLDMMMPEMDGRELLARMKEREDLRSIPVVVISGLGEAETAAQCIAVGAEDFLTKPFHPMILKARVEACLEKKRLRDAEAAHLSQLLALQADLDRRNRELEEVNRMLAQAALTDVLTGLPNRRAAMDELSRIWASACRHERPLACVMVDVDHFKRVNDTFGHDVGDEVSRAWQYRLRSATRQSEAVFPAGRRGVRRLL